MTYLIRPEPPRETPVTLVLTLTPTEALELAAHWNEQVAWSEMTVGGRDLGQSLHQALLAAARP